VNTDAKISAAMVALLEDIDELIELLAGIAERVPMTDEERGQLMQLRGDISDSLFVLQMQMRGVSPA